MARTAKVTATSTKSAASRRMRYPGGDRPQAVRNQPARRGRRGDRRTRAVVPALRCGGGARGGEENRAEAAHPQDEADEEGGLPA